MFAQDQRSRGASASATPTPPAPACTRAPMAITDDVVCAGVPLAATLALVELIAFVAFGATAVEVAPLVTARPTALSFCRPDVIVTGIGVPIALEPSDVAVVGPLSTLAVPLHAVGVPAVAPQFSVTVPETWE